LKSFRTPAARLGFALVVFRISSTLAAIDGNQVQEELAKAIVIFYQTTVG